VSHSIVLFLFASQGLEHFLASSGLPTIPLVPVSSSQAVVGAVIGIGLLKGGHGIKWGVLGNIATGWVITPITAGIVCFIALFVLQNVFNQQVYRDASYTLSEPVLVRLQQDGIEVDALAKIRDTRFNSVRKFRATLSEQMSLSEKQESTILSRAKIDIMFVDEGKLWRLGHSTLSKVQKAEVWNIVGERFQHSWMLDDALAQEGEAWQPRPPTKVNKLYNKKLKQQREEVHDLFRVPGGAGDSRP